jgi:hypothetical protein
LCDNFFSSCLLAHLVQVLGFLAVFCCTSKSITSSVFPPLSS